MQQDAKTPEKSKENEVDLGVFYIIASRIFKKIGDFFILIGTLISKAVIALLLLVKRNIVWLSIGTILGSSFGLYKYLSTGPVFYSKMVVKTNFESSRLLYQKINYFNALIGEGKISDLQKTFSISESDAKQLLSFAIEPVKDYLQIARLYKTNFLDYNRYTYSANDTSLKRIIKYDDFTNNLTRYDYPLHTITLYSGSDSVFPNIQQGILKSMSENPSLLRIREGSQETLAEEEKIITLTLNDVDSLRQAYTKRILNTSGNPPENGGNVMFMQGTPRSPEIDLFDKQLNLKNELMEVKRKRLDQQDILQVYSDFNGVGNRISKFKDPLIFTLIGFLGTLVIILIVRLYRDLSVIETRLQQKSGK